jgi:hypothetical protein
MARTIALLFLLAFCSATAMQAQAPTPKPDPELKKLSVFLGHWTCEGESKTGPLGPGGKYTGEYTARMILGGFFFQARWAEKRPSGETRSLEIVGYDPVNKNLVSNGYEDGGGTWSGAVNVSGSGYTYTGKYFLAGKQYLTRVAATFGADLMSMTRKLEISADGTTWTPYEEKWTKVSAAAKK